MSRSIFPYYYDIVILPPESLSSTAIEISERIHRLTNAKLVLGPVHYKPHISIFHVAVKSNHLAEMIRILKTLAASTALDRLTVRPVEPYRSGVGYLMQVVKNRTLQQLHENTLAAINPLRDRKFPNPWQYPEFQKPIYRENVRRYGSPVVGRFFTPHITISYGIPLRRSEASTKVTFRKLRDLQTKSFTFTPTSLVVCHIGPNHSCHGVLAHLPFSRS